MSIPHSPWTLARRAERMNPSVIREILKITEQPGVISLAGGLPAPDTFPVEQVQRACERVLGAAPRDALQYAASEGYGPLREWVAGHLGGQGLRVEPSQVLITTGSQQGLDYLAKALISPGDNSSIGGQTAARRNSLSSGSSSTTWPPCAFCNCAAAAHRASSSLAAPEIFREKS